MAAGDQYRFKAAEFQAKADQQTRPLLRRPLEALTRVYLRLARQADRNPDTDTSYGSIQPPRGTDTEPSTR